MTIRAFASGVLSMMGHNPVIGARDVSGEVRFAPQALEVKELRLSVATASLSVQNDMSDKDRREIERVMREHVLETDRYPAIAFEGSKVTVERGSSGPLRAEVDGDLTVHGITRPHRVPVQVFLIGDTLRAQGEFNPPDRLWYYAGVGRGRSAEDQERAPVLVRICLRERRHKPTCAWPSLDKIVELVPGYDHRRHRERCGRPPPDRSRTAAGRSSSSG